MTRPIPPQARAFIAEHEACRLVAYDDLQPNRRVFATTAEVRGRATIGFGHTGTVDAQDVVDRLRITREDALALLGADLAEAARKLAGVVDAPVLASLTDNQYSALLSFVFNLGANGNWTIWRMLNERRYDQVPVQMARFVNAGGRKLQGLVNRRNAEIALWSTAEPGSSATDLPSSVTRSIETPPTPEPTPPAHKDPVVVGGAITGATVLGGMVTYAKPVLESINGPWAFAFALIIALGLFLVITGRWKIRGGV